MTMYRVTVKLERSVSNYRQEQAKFVEEMGVQLLADDKGEAIAAALLHLMAEGDRLTEAQEARRMALKGALPDEEDEDEVDPDEVVAAPRSERSSVRRRPL